MFLPVAATPVHMLGCRFVGVHSKVVLGPLSKAGISPSVRTVPREIKASEVPIAYGYNEERLDVVLISAADTISASMAAFRIVDGCVLCVAAGDETAISGESGGVDTFVGEFSGTE